jgi:hypothetical protein
MRRDPSVSDLHHSDIITFALTRLAGQYAREKADILRDLRNCRAVDTPARLSYGVQDATSASGITPSQRAVKQTRDQ